VLLHIKVKPNSRNPRIEEADGGLTVYLKAPPVEGKANQELIASLAARYRVPKARVRIKSGAGSRNKIVEVQAQS
jgi:uncharacterized protein (TIGR00251 family)